MLRWGKNNKRVTPQVLSVIALTLVALGYMGYKKALYVAPVSINQDPTPMPLQGIASAPASPVSSSAASKPPGVAGWSSDTALHPAASMGEAQDQAFPPAPKAADAKDLTQAQAQSAPPPPQWSGTRTVTLPPHFQPNTQNKAFQARQLTATGLPTSLIQVTEARQKIAAGETFFQRPRNERTPVQFARDK